MNHEGVLCIPGGGPDPLVAAPGCTRVAGGPVGLFAPKDYWDLSGLIQDCQLYFLVGYRLANDAKTPEWKPGAEFKAKRDAARRQAAPAAR